MGYQKSYVLERQSKDALFVSTNKINMSEYLTCLHLKKCFFLTRLKSK